MNEDKYICPECDADVTSQVRSECKATRELPTLVVPDKEGEESDAADTVIVQCPKGHWGRYTCPRASE